MRKPFEEALADLLAEYADEDIDELISALELQTMALKEQESSNG